jgi:signal transduction histidine kinase
VSRSLLRDAALPAVVGGIATVEVLSVRPPAAGTGLAILWVACLLLVFRRRWPIVVGTLAAIALLLPLFGTSIQDLTSPVLVAWVAQYAVGRWLPDLRGLPVVGLYVAILAAELVTGGSVGVGDVVWGLTLLLPAYFVGVLVRRWTDRTHRLAAETERLTAAQEQVRRETAAAERARIARELHDVLAHSVSAMVLQVSAAEDLLRRDPDRAAQLLQDVADVGRRALSETGRLLHLIRDTDDELGLAPDAGLERLDELVEGFRRRGMPVDVEVDGPLTGLPGGVDLSAYRIVQEALTNALRHGDGAAARVRVVRSPARVEIHVTNRAGAGGTAGSGLGLLGVSERVAVFGGSLRHGRDDDGRYVLDVTLPVPETTETVA